MATDPDLLARVRRVRAGMRRLEPRVSSFADRDVNAPAEPGNIDIHARPVVKGPDGRPSTVRSVGIGEDDREVLVPTVVADRIVSDDDAVRRYREIGEHLGKFSSEHDANVYARALHDEQAGEYTEPAPDTVARVKKVRASMQPGSGISGKVAQGLTGLATGTLDFIKGMGTALRRVGRESGLAEGTSRALGTPDESAAPGAVERWAGRRRELVDLSAPEPEGVGDVLARAGGYVVAQGAPYVALGGPMRAAAGLGEAAALPAGASLAQRAGRGVIEAAKDALALAPLDVASTAESPEASSAGALGDLFDSDNLRRIAADPGKRALFETTLGLSADVALRALHGGGRVALEKLLGPDVAEGLNARPLTEAVDVPPTPAPRPMRTRDPIRSAAPGSGIEAARRALESHGKVEGIGALPAESERLKLEREMAAPIELAPPEPVASLPRAVDESFLQDFLRRSEPAPEAAPASAIEAATRAMDEPPARDVAPKLEDYEVVEREALGERDSAPPSHRAGPLLPDDTAVGTPRMGSSGKGVERAKKSYEGLSDKQLAKKYREMVRSMGRMEAAAEGGPTSFALGRRTQQQDRVLALESVMRERGIDLRAAREDLYEGLRPSEVMEQNRDLTGGTLGEMSDEELAAEVRDSVAAWKANPELAATNERMTLLYEEAQKPGRKIPDDVWQSIVVSLARVGLGAGAGYAASRTGASDDQALLAAVAFGGVPEKMARDLFGEAIRQGPRQLEMFVSKIPQGVREAIVEAEGTVSRLEGKVTRGVASPAEKTRYDEARALLRWSEGHGLDAAEVRARIRDAAPPQPDDTRDMFDPERGSATTGMVGRLAAGSAGAVAGAALDEESPERGAVVGGLVGLGGASVVAAGARKLRPKVRPPTALEARYLADPAVRRVAESIGQAPAKTLAPRGVVERAKALGAWLRFKAVREPAPLEALEKQLTQGSSTDLRDELARARGWLPSATVHVEDHFTPVLQSAEEAPALARALGKAERGLELAGAGKETTPQQLADWQATVQRLGVIPEVRKAVDDLRAYNRALLEMKRDVGLLTQEQFNEIVQSGQAYVPLLPAEIAEALPSTPGRASRYSPNKGSGVRKMSDALNEAVTVDPWDQAIVDTYETFDKVARQRVANTLAELVESNPGLVDHLIERLPGKPERAPTDGRMIEALVDGERRYYVVHDRDLADAWLNFNRPIRSTMLRAAGGMRRFFQAGVTGTPVFALVNAMRDFMMTAVQYPMKAKGTALATGIGAAAGALADDESPGKGALAGAAAGLGVRGGLHLSEHLLRTASALNDILGPEVLGAVAGGAGSYLTADEDDNGFLRFLTGAGVGAAGGRGARALGKSGDRAIAREFEREGGGGFGFYARNITDARKMRDELLKEGVSASDFVNPKSWWDALQYVSRAIETAPRLARYKSMRAAGESIPRSVFEARDLSLDFAVKPGSQLVKGATEAIPFLNPSIQGLDKLGRLLSNKKTWLPAAATIMAPSVALWGMIHEDKETADEYASRPLWERNSYWLIPKKWFGQESGFVRVPKPFELGLIYASLPERVLDYQQMQDPEQLNFALKDMWGQYGPGNLGGVPMPFGPAYDVTRGEHGYDSFRRREIDPEPWKKLPPELQYDDRTSSLAVAMGRALDRSPAKIDYLMRGYTGSLGGDVLDATSRAARATGLDKRPSPMTPERPFVSRFHTDPSVTTEPELTLRRKWKRAEEAFNGAQALLDEGDVEGARAFAREHRADLLAYYQLKPSKDLVDSVAKVRRQVRDSRAPSEKKREALSKLNRGLSARLEGASR